MVRSEQAAQGKSGGTKKKDPTWKYCIEAETTDNSRTYKYLYCQYCNKKITKGVKRLKDHIGRTRKSVAPCAKVLEEVKQELLDYLKQTTLTKHMNKQRFEEMVGSGSYFGSHTSLKEVNSCPTPSSSCRGVRGPMARFMVNLTIDDDDNAKAAPIMSTTNAKKVRNQACLGIGRFFFENEISFNVGRIPFVSMCHSIGSHVKVLKPPIMYELRT